MSLASVRGLGFRFGRHGPVALDDVDLDVAPGEIVLLDGPSGSGKSTLLRALGGLLPEFHGGRMEGRIEVCGQAVGVASAATMARSASLAFQDPENQAVMSGVARDVAFGPECLGLPRDEIGPAVDWALEQAEASHLRTRTVSELSGGERQRAAVASVLAMRRPLLLLDEPTSQLDDGAAAALLGRIRRLADERGVGVVLAEHRADRARPVADRVVSLARPAADTVGTPTARPVAGTVAGAIHGLTASHGERVVLDDLDLELFAGQVTGLVGPSGAGKTTLLRVVAGLHAPRTGRVVLAGRDVTALAAEQRFPRVGLVPQAPGRHLLRETVRDETAVALANLGLRGRERRRRGEAELARLDLTHLADRHPLDLSVGERERVAVAAMTVARPGLLCLDEPTRGVDPVARRRVGALMRTLADDGAAVLLATHDPHLVAEWCDRVLDLAGGRLRERSTVAR